MLIRNNLLNCIKIDFMNMNPIKYFPIKAKVFWLHCVFARYLYTAAEEACESFRVKTKVLLGILCMQIKSIFLQDFNTKPFEGIGLLFLIYGFCGEESFRNRRPLLNKFITLNVVTFIRTKDNIKLIFSALFQNKISSCY